MQMQRASPQKAKAKQRIMQQYYLAAFCVQAPCSLAILYGDDDDCDDDDDDDGDDDDGDDNDDDGDADDDDDDDDDDSKGK